MEAARQHEQLASDLIIEFAHTYLKVPEGLHVGKPLKLRDWQQDIIRLIYDRPTRRAIISFGRKNGKTALTAILILAHLVGPMARRNSQIYSAAQSRDQAALVFTLAAKMIRMNAELNELVTIRDSRKELYCGLTGVIYKALAAEATTAYGLSPSLIIHDELGTVRGPRNPMYEALETATGAQANPLSIIISTQAPTDSDLLSTLIDDAKAAHDPRVVLSLHTAPIDGDPFDDETLKAANPAFGDFLNADEVRAMAQDAKRMPSREPEFRNLILNQRVEANDPFVSHTLWSSLGAEPKPIEGIPVYAGLDLSAVNDLTALVLIGRVDNCWQVHPTFWLPKEGLYDKAQQDHAPYDQWAKDGFLATTPGKSIDYEYIAALLIDVFLRYDIRKMAFDRWHFLHLRPCLLRAGFPEDELEEKFQEFGQGYQSMASAMRAFESAIIDGRLAHGNHPVLAMCAANAVVETDVQLNKKLVKGKSNGRIDGMVALAMAIGAAPLAEEPQISVYDQLAGVTA